jgi:hypothetical protein
MGGYLSPFGCDLTYVRFIDEIYCSVHVSMHCVEMGKMIE